VLAGAVGALLGQGLDPFDAATTAAWVHGRAGDALEREFGEAGIVATDLPPALARVGLGLEAEA
jgi:NAD(P)H-hydrate epimerase